MLEATRNFLVLSLSVMMIVILGTGTPITAQEDEKPSKRSDFPVLQPSSAYSVTKEFPFEKQLELSEIVVDATVNKVYPKEKREYVPEPGSVEARVYEEMGVKNAYYSVLKVEMRANEYVKGNAGETFIMSIVAFNLDSAPDFKPGDRFLLTLDRYIDGTYCNVTPVSSYFFVAHDEKTYPAGDDAPTQRFSGKNLSAVKQDIKRMVS